MLPNTELICYFLDVGQGASQIITLGKQKAIVIDAGPPPTKKDKRNIPVQLLNDLQIDYIEALILSHNDWDHAGNTINILTQYKGNIGKIFLLQDRSTNDLKDIFVLLKEYVDEKYIHTNDIQRLEKQSGQKKVIFQETRESGTEILLEALYPLSIMDSLIAERRGKPNITCSVVRLQVGNSNIVFSGDALIEAWKRIYTENRGVSLESNIATLPHHGGIIDTLLGTESFDFFNRIIDAKTLIVSVGPNSYGHPLPNAIHAATRAGKEILCTQMTRQCCSVYDRLCSSSQKFYPPILSQSQQDGLIACAGTVAVNVSPDAIEIQHLEKYRRWKSQHSGRMCIPFDPSYQ